MDFLSSLDAVIRIDDTKKNLSPQATVNQANESC